MKKILLSICVLCWSYNAKAQCDSTLPVSENFSDATAVNYCWDFIDYDGDGRNWYVANLDGNNGLISESYRDDTGVIYPDNFAITQVIDLRSYSPGSNIQVTWKVRVSDWSFDKERYIVYAATGNQISNFTSSSVYFYEDLDGSGGNWGNRSLNISSLAGNYVYIAFRHYFSAYQDAINIDDVVISASTLGVEDFNKDNFKYYYTTSDKTLTLKSSNLPIDSVKIYNLLGQTTVNKTLSNTTENIDLSSLTDGIYIAQVEINGSTKSIKFLKQ